MSKIPAEFVTDGSVFAVPEILAEEDVPVADRPAIAREQMMLRMLAVNYGLKFDFEVKK